MENYKKPKKAAPIVLAFLVVTAGILLLLFNAGMLPLFYKPIIFSWQMLLIALGFTCLFARRKWVFGLVVMLVGGYFMLPKLQIESLNFIWQNGWAILLIVLGVIIFCKTLWGKKHEFPRRRHHKHFRKFHNSTNPDFAEYYKSGISQPGYINRDFVFSGSKEKVDFQDFKGGEINTVFGGMELDLSDAQLAEGTNQLNINIVLGGIVLILPIEWKVEIHQSQVFGTFVDNRPKPTFEIDENKVLIINASSVFGGGEIKIKNQPGTRK